MQFLISATTINCLRETLYDSAGWISRVLNNMLSYFRFLELLLITSVIVNVYIQEANQS
jgi:hypothetical protein